MSFILITSIDKLFPQVQENIFNLTLLKCDVSTESTVKMANLATKVHLCLNSTDPKLMAQMESIKENHFKTQGRSEYQLPASTKLSKFMKILKKTNAWVSSLIDEFIVTPGASESGKKL